VERVFDDKAGVYQELAAHESVGRRAGAGRAAMTLAVPAERSTSAGPVSFATFWPALRSSSTEQLLEQPSAGQRGFR
jgi:hypothetical protein